MRVIPAPLEAALSAEVQRPAMLWLLTNASGGVLRLTGNDQDVVVPGDGTYTAALGVVPSSIVSNAGLAVGSMDATGALADAGLAVEDIRAGLWDYAEFRVRTVDWSAPALGFCRESRGWLGQFKYDGFTYTAELRGLADKLNRSKAEIVQPGCHHTLGDAKCTVILGPYSTTSTVTAVTDQRQFDTGLSGATVNLTPGTTGAPPLDYFASGKVIWLTGANAGRSMEIKTSALDGELTLQLPMVGTIAPGDTFTAVAGCGHGFEQCRNQFGNGINFGGCPEVPGIARLIRNAGQ